MKCCSLGAAVVNDGEGEKEKEREKVFVKLLAGEG